MKRKHSIKPPVLLKTILDILFWILVIGLAGRILITVLFYFTDVPVDLKINDFEITEFTLPVVVGIILKIMVSAIFIYIVYVLRKVVRSFFKRKLFVPIQISGLKIIGNLIIIATITEVAIDFLLRLFLEQKTNIGIDLKPSFNSLWFTLALGLFFILLSKSFGYAKGLQEENELTV